MTKKYFITRPKQKWVVRKRPIWIIKTKKEIEVQPTTIKEEIEVWLL